MCHNSRHYSFVEHIITEEKLSRLLVSLSEISMSFWWDYTSAIFSFAWLWLLIVFFYNVKNIKFTKTIQKFPTKKLRGTKLLYADRSKQFSLEATEKILHKKIRSKFDLISFYKSFLDFLIQISLSLLHCHWTRLR